MTDRRPENLEFLAERFGGKEVIENIFSGESIEVDGIEFVSGYVADSSAERFYILKPMHLIERYRDLAAFGQGGNIVEIGIAEGGSAALLALWADPAKLVTLDNEPSRLKALDDFAAARGFGDRLVPYYGTDQGDRSRVAEIVDQEFGDAPIDLVIDDASHMYGPTRASFETLFPRIRPGGRFVIEDWEADIAMADSVRIALQNPSAPDRERRKASMKDALGKPPAPSTRVSLSRLILELVILAGGQNGAIAEMSINKSFVSITRGEAVIDPPSFRLDGYGVNGHGLLQPRPED